MICHFKKSLPFLLLFSIIALIFSQCGNYSFKGSLAPHLKTVAIPMFDDQTAEFGVKEELTDEVIKRFIEDNSLKITDRQNSDVLIEGRISSIRDQAGGYDREETVQDVKVYVTVNVKCTDQSKRKVMWEGAVSQFETFEPNDTDSRREAITKAIKLIADDILNKTVSGW